MSNSTVKDRLKKTKTMSKLVKICVFLACYAIYPFSFLFPRSRNRWAFGSFRGSFNDNAKYLFIYCCEQRGKQRCVWLSKSKATVSFVRSKGLPAYHIASPKGIWTALTSKYWFFNAYTSDILHCLSGGAVCVNLWHGVGLKRAEFNITTGKLAERYQQKKFTERFFHPETFRRPDWLLTSTPFQTAMFASAFRIPVDRCLELGYPRNSILLCNETERRQHIEAYENETTQKLIAALQKEHYSEVYLYMPTWRDSQLDAFTQHLDLNRLDTLMQKKNALLLLKPHVNVKINPLQFAQMHNVRIVDGNTDIYPVMPYTTVLITDYSSVLYDYILMDGKGVILYLYDYEEYVRDRDFYYPFDENVVGAKVYDFEALYHCMETGDHLLADSDRQPIVDRFWGDTAHFNACQMLMERFGLHP